MTQRDDDRDDARDDGQDDARDYEVGYGKPPVSGQFKKGQSGNPKGRPKGAKGVLASMKRELESTITVREAGREIRISKLDAVAKQLANKAVSGDMKAIDQCLKLDPDLFGGLGSGGEMMETAVAPEPVDYDILRDFLSQLPAEDAPGDAEAPADDPVDDRESDDDGS